MSRKVLIALLGVLLVAALAGAGTFAAFSDVETSTANSFTAGTLDLKINDADGASIPALFTVSDVKPGDSGTATYTLKNSGTIAGYLDLSGITMTNTEGTNTEAEVNTAEPGDLGANMNVTVTIGTTTVYTGPLASMAGAYDLDIALGAGGSTTLIIAWSVPGTVGNDIQGDVTNLAFTVELDQTAD